MPWIIGILALLLLLWVVWEIFDHDIVLPLVQTVEPAAAPVASVDIAERLDPSSTPPPPNAADNTPIPVSLIVAGPAGYVARPVVGTARVGEVVSDRGFWIEQGGRRMFAAIAQAPNMAQPVDMETGQQVRLSGVVHDASMPERIGELASPTRELLAGQPAFVLVHPNNVSVVAEAAALAW